MAHKQREHVVNGRFTQEVEGGVVEHLGNGRLKGKEVEVFRVWSWEDWLTKRIDLETQKREETVQD